MEEIDIKEPHLPEDFKMILKQLEMVIEIYHELIMVWAQPRIVYRTDEPTITIEKGLKT